MKKLLFILGLMFLLAGCSTLKTPEIKGVVVDAETGKPIADARIHASWRPVYSNPGGQFSGDIVNEVSFTTGPDGKFVIPSYWLVNHLPYPFGQGGNFGFVIYALGYKAKWFGSRQNGEFERIYSKEIIIGQESNLKLSPIHNPKEWAEDFGEIFGHIQTDEKLFNSYYREFVRRYGDGKWDKISQLNLFRAYLKLKDIKGAKRKAREIIKTFPDETNYVLESLKESKIHLGDD